MSDMLQLVGEVENSKCAKYKQYHCLSLVNLNDKLKKHVGH